MTAFELTKQSRKGKSAPMIRLTPEAYVRLKMMATESRRGITQVASQAITYAFEHVEYVEEKEDK